jgi:glutaconate CoA-transferase, subunit B
VSLEDVRQNTAWDLRVPDELEGTTPPTEEDLRLIREELDPGGAYAR